MKISVRRFCFYSTGQVVSAHKNCVDLKVTFKLDQETCIKVNLIDICCCLQTASFMFKFLHHWLPATFNNYFTKVSSLHHYSTRSSTVSFVLPSYLAFYSLKTVVKCNCVQSSYTYTYSKRQIVHNDNDILVGFVKSHQYKFL